MSAEVGTVFHLEWLPKRRRVGPSASLDESIRKLFASYIMVKVRCQRKYLFPFKGQHRYIIELGSFPDKGM